MEQYHWYSLAFVWYTEINEHSHTKNVHDTYIGNGEKKVTMGDIKQAKDFQGVPDRATMINCSYLGYMTREEFNSESK